MAIYNSLNIKDLNQIEEVTDGNFLIVEDERGTNVIDYRNFVVGPNNVSFYSNFVTLSTNVNSLSSQTSSDKTELLTRINNVSAQASSELIAASGNIIARTLKVWRSNGSNTVGAGLFSWPVTVNKPNGSTISVYPADINLMPTTTIIPTSAQFYMSSFTDSAASVSFTIASTVPLFTTTTMNYSINIPYY